MAAGWKKTFFIIYTGQAISITASNAVQFAIIWDLTVRTGNANVLAMAVLAGYLPSAIMGPFAGVWIDRISRKVVMIVSDAYVALTGIIFIAVLITRDTGEPPLWFIFVVLCLRAVGYPFRTPALQASVPALVPKEMLTKVAGWSQMTQSIGMVAGPPLGSLLITFLDLAGVVMFDVIGAGIAILSIVFVKIPRIIGDRIKRDVIKELHEGFLEITRNKALLAISIPMLVAVMIFIPIATIVPLMIREHFAGEAPQNAMAQVALAVGLLSSSMMMGFFGSSKHRFLLISMSIFVMGVCFTIGGLLTAYQFVIFVALMGVSGFCGSLFMVPFMSLIQESTPQKSLGRVMALVTTLQSIATPVGLVIAGPMAEQIGVEKWFWASGIVMMVIGVWAVYATRGHEIAARQ